MKFSASDHGLLTTTAPFTVQWPIFKVLVPKSRFDGMRTRIVAVGKEFLVMESCLIFDGKCPIQGLMLDVFTRSKIIPPAEFERAKAIVDSATCFKFEDLEKREHTEDRPFETGADQTIVKYN